MKGILFLTVGVIGYMVFALSSCALQEEMAPPAKPAPVAEAKKAAPAEKKAPEAKAKPVKVSGNVGLVDLEKNYMILVTKEGKLVTVDFSDKTKVTKFTPQPAKMKDVNLGSSGTISYRPKVIELESIEYKVKAKKGE